MIEELRMDASSKHHRLSVHRLLGSTWLPTSILPGRLLVLKY
jgi:hypothetical protein